MTRQGSKVKTQQNYDFFHTMMWQIQKFEKSFFVVAFLSVVLCEKKKITMSIAEEEIEGQGSYEPTREQCLLDATGCLYKLAAEKSCHRWSFIWVCISGLQNIYLRARLVQRTFDED